MDAVTVFCPAKVNLTLAVTGQRADGYHNLVSLAAPLKFGDVLKLRRTRESGLSLAVRGEAAPCGEENLVLRAARRFLEQFPSGGGFVFELEKKIPLGAGLGGGSSDAAGALMAINEILEFPADRSRLAETAASLGADCPLFLHRGPVVLRGKGEALERITEEEARRLRGRPLVLFKPFFGVPTEWAYRRLARAGCYTDAGEAESEIAAWRKGEKPLEAVMKNDFENVVGRKYPAISILLETLRRDPGVAVLMSGSGSACYAFPKEEETAGAIYSRVCEAYGEDAFVVETEVA